MLEIVTKLLFQRQLTFESGHISLLKQRICMIPIDSLYRIQTTLDDTDLENLMYYSFKNAGKDWWGGMLKGFKLKNVSFKV